MATSASPSADSPDQAHRPLFTATKKQLKIAIATAGRFHVLDLARELHALGHDVKFYTYVLRGRAHLFGLPDECHVSLLPFAAPLLAWSRFLPRLAPRLRERWLFAMLNLATAVRLRRCDVFICMSGIYLGAARFAKARYGAAIWLERGSRHILSQDNILAEIPGAERPSPHAIRRELEGYRIADRIVIPSAHVEDSFRHDPSACAKLFRNPYGVDLRMFSLRGDRSAATPYTFIYVGDWSLRKGCDVLLTAVAKLSTVRLIHVGRIVDLQFPVNDGHFAHVDPVEQWQLAEHYASADAFVLASREEGLSVVLGQAIATGLPVVCTDRTGGADLAHTPALAARITVVPYGDADALAAAMTTLCERARASERLPALEESDRQALGWAAYAKRYSEELLRCRRR